MAFPKKINFSFFYILYSFLFSKLKNSGASNSISEYARILVSGSGLKISIKATYSFLLYIKTISASKLAIN